MTLEQLITKLRALRWTQEVRPGHPWNGDLLVRREDVEDLLKEAAK